MANIMLDPTTLGDGDSSPAAAWDGEKYEFIGVGYQGMKGLNNLSAATSVADGDIIDLTLVVVTPSTAGEIVEFSILLNNSTTLFKQSLISAGSFPFQSPPLAAGDELDMSFYTLSDRDRRYVLYDGDFQLIPTPSAPTPLSGSCFWTDFVGCVEECGNA